MDITNLLDGAFELNYELNYVLVWLDLGHYARQLLQHLQRIVPVEHNVIVRVDTEFKPYKAYVVLGLRLLTYVHQLFVQPIFFRGQKINPFIYRFQTIVYGDEAFYDYGSSN